MGRGIEPVPTRRNDEAHSAKTLGIELPAHARNGLNPIGLLFVTRWYSS